ncbi:hypothetical protein HDU89_003683 [Geranomyces variabilis]|nr:hypothetical protein HDU89_003683 [Geranomyces variabilis]
MDHPVAVAVPVTGHGSHNGAESALDMRTIFWTNLLLLGFNPPDYPNVELHAQIFAGRGGPSAAKAMEIIAHFLFTTLDTQAAQERLAKCWPIIDRNQSRDFRIAVVKWFETLKRDGKLPADVSVRKSYFDECRGERFERALLALSNCVLKQALRRECESAGTAVDEHLLESCDAEALKTHVVNAGKQFLDECKQHNEQEREWVAYKNELLSEHRQIATKMSQVEKDRRELDTILANAFGTPITPAAALARVKDKTAQIAHQWQTLERWVVTNRDNMQMVDDVLAGRTNLYRLEAIPAVAASGGASVAGPIANSSLDPLPPDVADIAHLWAKLYSNVITTIDGLVDTRADTPGVVVGSETVSELLERAQGDDPTPLLASIQDLKRRLGAELAVLSEHNAEILANAAGRRLSAVKEESNRASRTPAAPPPTRFRPQKATPVSTPVRLAAAGYTATPDAVHAIATAVRSEIATALDSADDYAAENEAAAVREKVDAAIADVAKRKQPQGSVAKSSAAESRPALGEKARQRERVSRPAVSATSSRTGFVAASTESDKMTTSAGLQSRPPAQRPTPGERKNRKDNPAAYEKLCERIVDFVNDMAESPRPSPPVPKRPAAVLARRQRAGSEDRANASICGKAPQTRTVVFSDGFLVEESEGDTREHDDDDKENAGAGDAITAALGTQAFRARAEITRTPERARHHGGSNTSTSSRRPPVPLLAVTSPHVLRLPQPSYGMPCSPSPTKTSLAAAHKPKTPSRLANIVTFDSSSDSLGSTVDAQSGLENGKDKATATAAVGDFLEGESSYQLDPDELDEIGRNAVPFFSLAQMDGGDGGGHGDGRDAAPAVEAVAVAAAAAEWDQDVDDDDFIMPATPRRTPRRETCDGLDLLGEWGSPSGSFGIASPSFRKDATPTSRVC